MKALIIEPHTAYTVENNGNYEDIRGIIHNLIDCVRGENFVGYVDDEGLLVGLPHNPIASILFGQYLVGTCVVYGCLNANGEYDGENYTVPNEVLQRVNYTRLVTETHRDFKIVG